MRIHPFEHRPLSVSEYKRAQGFPDDYHIIASVRNSYKFIGNAVPVELARSLAEQIFHCQQETLTKDARENTVIPIKQTKNIEKPEQLTLF